VLLGFDMKNLLRGEGTLKKRYGASVWTDPPTSFFHGEDLRHRKTARPKERSTTRVEGTDEFRHRAITGKGGFIPENKEGRNNKSTPKK